MSASSSHSPPNSPPPPRSPSPSPLPPDSPPSSSLGRRRGRRILAPDPEKEILRTEAKALLQQFDESSTLVSLIRDLNSTNPNVKSHAEALFDYLKNNYLASFSLRLLSSLRSYHPQSVDSRDCTFDILSRLLTRCGRRLWREIPSIQCQELKTLILDCLKNETSRIFLPKLHDFVSDLASQDAPGNQWPELIGYVFQSFDGTSEIALESALLLFSKLPPGCVDEETVNLDFLYEKLIGVLKSDIIVVVKLAAVKASTNLILLWIVPSKQNSYLGLLSETISFLFCLIIEGREDDAHVVLEELIKYAGVKPELLDAKFDAVVELMCMLLEEVALETPTKEEIDLENKTRCLVLKFVVALAKERSLQGRKMLLKYPQLLQSIVYEILRMLAEIDGNQDWQNLESDERDRGDMNICVFGMKGLAQLAAALGENVVGIIVKPISLGSLDENWQRRHAAVSFPAILAGSCPKALKQILYCMAEIVIKVVQEDFHPRVRWAAINTIKEFSKHLHPEFQDQYHQEVLPALLKAMDDIKNPRVQVQAASAMSDFVKNLNSEILKPHLNETFAILLKYLEMGKKLLKVEALRALASIANLLKRQFQDYYTLFMPYLKVIMVSEYGESNSFLLATSLECINMIWIAVGIENIDDDTDMVVNLLISWKGSNSKTDVLMRCQVLRAWGTLCKCLGQKFKPYLSVVIPRLLQSAQLNSYIAVPDDPTIELGLDESVQALILGDEEIWVKVDVLEEKAIACNVLYCCATELKESFYLWIDEVIHVLVPHFKFVLHEGIQKAALLAMPVILKSSKAATGKGNLKWYNESHFNELCFKVLSALVEALETECLNEIRAIILDSLEECMQISGVLEIQQVECFLGVIRVILQTGSSLSDKVMIIDAKHELQAEQSEEEEKVYAKAADCLATFIRTCKHSLSLFVDQLLSCTAMMWDNKKTRGQRRIALHIFLDIAKQCQENAFGKYCKSTLPFLLQACKYKNIEVQEVVTEAIGVCAEFGGSDFKSFVREAATCLITFIKDFKASDVEYVIAHDVAISALGKVIQFHRDEILVIEQFFGFTIVMLELRRD